MRPLHHTPGPLLTSTPPWECRWPVDSRGEEAHSVPCLPDGLPHCLTGCEMACGPLTIFQTEPYHSSRHHWLWCTSCRAVPRDWGDNSQDYSCNFLQLLHASLSRKALPPFSLTLPSAKLSLPLGRSTSQESCLHWTCNMYHLSDSVPIQNLQSGMEWESCISGMEWETDLTGTISAILATVRIGELQWKFHAYFQHLLKYVGLMFVASIHTLQVRLWLSRMLRAARSLCTNDFLDRYVIPAATSLANLTNILCSSLWSGYWLLGGQS